MQLSSIAQLVEQVAVNHLVASSSLARGAKNTKPDLLRIGLFFLFHESGRSAAWLARLPWEQEVVGSNPTAPTICSYKSQSLT